MSATRQTDYVILPSLTKESANFQPTTLIVSGWPPGLTNDSAVDILRILGFGCCFNLLYVLHDLRTYQSLNAFLVNVSDADNVPKFIATFAALPGIVVAFANCQGLQAATDIFVTHAPADFPIEAWPRLYDFNGAMRPVKPGRTPAFF
jgi:hypothetical protein